MSDSFSLCSVEKDFNMRYVFCHILVCNAWEGGEEIFFDLPTHFCMSKIW